MNFKVLCPQCQNPISYHQVHFPFMNDFGAMVIECSICKTKFNQKKALNSKTRAKTTYLIVECANPNESTITEGGEKINYYEYDESISLSEAKKDFPNAPIISEIVVTPPQKLEPCSNTDCLSLPNMKCPCGSDLPPYALATLKKENKIIKDGCKGILDMYYKWCWQDYKEMILELAAKCDSCKQDFIAYYARQIKKDSDCNWDALSFHLVSTNIPINRSQLMGIKTKTECMSILKTFLARWNLIADEILVISPYIGTIHQTDAQLIEDWKWLVDNCEQSKTRLFTKTQTINSIRSTYKSLGIDANLWITYGLEDALIKDFSKINNSHAKVYAGIIGNKVEILHGSANLVKGSSNENFCYDILDYEQFKVSYMDPLKIERQRNKSSSMYIRKEGDRYVYGEKRKNEILFKE
ncbi:MAG: hypothetical protein UHC59_08970 [Fibrobacteraceae bacterium]|nr:hypothetical protein [Fibrobacteraceae bacterium]